MKIHFLILAFAITSGFCGQVIKTDKHLYRYQKWPELRGQMVESAAAHIHSEHPEFSIKVRYSKHGINSEILPNNVFLYEDENGYVVNEPESVEEVPLQLTIWPEVVGLEVEEAKDIILTEKPEAKVQTVLSANSKTDDLDVDRVKIFVDSHNLVVETPRSG